MPVSREASLLVAGSRLLSRTPHCVADAQTRGCCMLCTPTPPHAPPRLACLAGAGATLRPAAERLHAASHAEPVHAGAEPAVPGHQAAVECRHVGQGRGNSGASQLAGASRLPHVHLQRHPFLMKSMPHIPQARAAASPCTLTVTWRWTCGESRQYGEALRLLRTSDLLRQGPPVPRNASHVCCQACAAVPGATCAENSSRTACHALL